MNEITLERIRQSVSIARASSSGRAKRRTKRIIRSFLKKSASEYRDSRGRCRHRRGASSSPRNEAREGNKENRAGTGAGGRTVNDRERKRAETRIVGPYRVTGVCCPSTNSCSRLSLLRSILAPHYSHSPQRGVRRARRTRHSP